MKALLIPFLLLPASAPAAAPAQAPLQDEQPPEDNRADIKELIKKLDGHAGKRGKEDQQAVGVIDELVGEFEDCGPKDRGAIVKALDKCFKEKRQEEDGIRQNQLYLAAATALGEMYPESVKVLLSWIGHKSHDADLALQRTLIKELGQSKSKDARKPLIKLLKNHQAQIQAAAAEALGEFDEDELKVRKEAFEELLKLMMSVKGQVDSDYNDTTARDRWDVISAPIITSLKRLSGHEENDPGAWQRWWNKNKKTDWDEA
jgi:hypothetical protein